MRTNHSDIDLTVTVVATDIRSQRENSFMVFDQYAHPARTVVHPLDSDDLVGTDPQNGSNLDCVDVIYRSAPDERRSRKREPSVSFQMNQTDTTFLDDDVAPWSRTGAQPGVTGPQGRMTGKKGVLR